MRFPKDAGLNIFAVLADSIYVDQRNGKPRVGAVSSPSPL